MSTLMPQDVWITDEGITIHDWMRPRYGMPFSFGDTCCLVYARIYEVTHHNLGIYCEPQAALARTIDRSRRQVNGCLRKLVEWGLIEVVDLGSHERTGIRSYRALPKPANAAMHARMKDAEQQLSKHSAPQPQADWVDEDTFSSQDSNIGKPDSVTSVSLPPTSPSLEATNEKEEEDEDLKTLEHLWRKKGNPRFRYAVKAAWDELIKEGYQPQDILEIAQLYITQFFSLDRPEKDRNIRFMPYLNNWLSNGHNARRLLNEAGKLPRQDKPEPDSENNQPRFCKANDGIRTFWYVELSGMSPIELPISLGDSPTHEELQAALESLELNFSRPHEPHEERGNT